MLRDIDYNSDNESIKLKEELNNLIEKENHYKRINKVFEGEDGIKILEWILDECGYFREPVREERKLGKLDFARYLFDEITMASSELAAKILERRMKKIQSLNQDAKNKLHEQIRSLSSA